VHWIGHPGLKRAIEDFLKRERPAVEREQHSLERYMPFKRG
jgi:predicted N-acyltransferase